MTSLFKQFKTDPELERAGVWLEYGFNERTEKPIRLLCARAGGANTNFQKKLEAAMKPYRRQVQTETMDNKVAERILKKVYADAIVLGWEEVDDENDQPMPFTAENCVKLFEALPDLFRDVQDATQKVAVYRAEVMEADAGN
jgi:hypothetical protein